MNSHPFDVIVAGLGVMGAATVHALAERGARVLGIDRHDPPHALGSSHGRTRIIREAYYEHPLYVPLVRRALELWRKLENEAPLPLLRKTGGLSIGPPGSRLVEGAAASAREHDVPHEILDAAEVRRRFPDFHVLPGSSALYEPGAGLLDPEACVRTLLLRAVHAGAIIRSNEPVLTWTADRTGVRVYTHAGAFAAHTLILTLGAWLPELAQLHLPLQVERQTMFWFEPRDGVARHWPYTLWETTNGTIFATFPDLGEGVKAQLHHGGETTTAASVRRAPDRDDELRVRRLLEEFVPAANGARRDGTVCLYTNSPDAHFTIDTHPAHANVVLCSACSGHGFKFAPAIGETLANWALTGQSGMDVTPFRITRFSVAT
jgi:sarcosine oxidase